MIYTLDTEFYEHAGERGHVIELISLALVRDDGAELYLENSNFDWTFAEQREQVASTDRGLWVLDTPRWLEENVKPHLSHSARFPGHHLGRGEVQTAFSPHVLRRKVEEFIGDDRGPQFWAYYADYDWVAFCSLWGRMLDLPPHFPKYCLDIKQELVRRPPTAKLPRQVGGEHNALEDARHNMVVLSHLGVVT